MDAGNPEETWEALGIPRPVQIARACLCHAGSLLELTDDIISDCNRWDPLTDLEVQQRDERRHLYQLRVRTAAERAASKEKPCP